MAEIIPEEAKQALISGHNTIYEDQLVCLLTLQPCLVA